MLQVSSLGGASTSIDNLSEMTSLLRAGEPGLDSDVEDIDGLFGDIDWASANFSELERQWRAELAAIEKVGRRRRPPPG